MSKLSFKVITLFLVLGIMTAAYPDLPTPTPDVFMNAKSGNVIDQLHLGLFYEKQNKKTQSVYWFKKAADQGDANGQGMTAGAYLDGRGVPMNYNLAYHYFKLSADQNNPGGLNGLGLCYMSGLGVKKDPFKAKELFKKSANQGFAGGIFNLGQIYYYGKTGELNKAKGIQLYKKAAMKGAEIAQYRLGSVYASNRKNSGTTQNAPLAYMWVTISKLNGYKDDADYDHIFATIKQQHPYCIAIGQNDIGVMYKRGVARLPQDNNQAFQWVQKAYQTDPNLAAAQLNLAKFYFLGTGTPKNPERALALTQQAANTPYAPAQQYLANFYLNGVATKQDLVKAYAWLLLAKYTYENPDKKYYSRYVAPCRPSYEGDKLQNAKTAQIQMDRIKPQLSTEQLKQAMVFFNALESQQATLS